jgi:hypothetical protein
VTVAIEPRARSNHVANYVSANYVTKPGRSPNTVLAEWAAW